MISPKRVENLQSAVGYTDGELDQLIEYWKHLQEVGEVHGYKLLEREARGNVHGFESIKRAREDS